MIIFIYFWEIFGIRYYIKYYEVDMLGEFCFIILYYGVLFKRNIFGLDNLVCDVDYRFRIIRLVI